MVAEEELHGAYCSAPACRPPARLSLDDLLATRLSLYLQVSDLLSSRPGLSLPFSVSYRQAHRPRHHTFCIAAPFLPSPNPHKHEGRLQGGQHGTLLGENIFRLTKLYLHGRECPAARGSSAGEHGAYYDVHTQKYPRYETARAETVNRLETQDATCDASRVELRVIPRAPNPPTRQHHRRPDGPEEHLLLTN